MAFSSLTSPPHLSSVVTEPGGQALMDHRDMAGGYPVHCAFGVELRLSPRVVASVPFGSIG